MVSSLSKPFFTFKSFSGYSFNIASLLWHKFKVIFYCQSYEVIFAPKTVKIEKHAIVGTTKVSYRARSQLKRLKIEKLV